MTYPHALSYNLAAADLVVLSERKRICVQCGRPFLPRAMWRFTCSQACRTAYIADAPEIDQ